MATDNRTPSDSPTQYKTCTKCGECKPLSEFSRDKRNRDGLHAYCKACMRKYRQANAERLREYQREYYAANAERILERKREYNKANAERKREYYAANAERLREYQREYHAANAERRREQRREYLKANAERIAEYKREYLKANAERVREREREYRKANPEIARAKSHRQRARRRNAGGTYTADDIRALTAGQTDKRGVLRCWHCGEAIEGKYHVDHFIPLAKGGTNDPSNLRISCAACNVRKGAKMPSDFNGRLI